MPGLTKPIRTHNDLDLIPDLVASGSDYSDSDEEEAATSREDKEEESKKRRKLDLCPECGNNSPPVSFEWILCNQCEVWYHECCVGVLVKDYEVDSEWLCHSCSSPQAGLLLSQIQAAPPQERLSMLGDKLFPLIQAICPDQPGKILSKLLSPILSLLDTLETDVNLQLAVSNCA